MSVFETHSSVADVGGYEWGFEGVVDHAMVLERFVKRSIRKEWMARTARRWALQTTGRALKWTVEQTLVDAHERD